MSTSNELTRCSDALAAAVAALLPGDADPALIAAFRQALSDWQAATLGSATRMVAGMIVSLDAKIDRLSHARITQVHDTQVDLDRVSVRVHALEDAFLDSGTVGQLVHAQAALALKIGMLESRQVGDGDQRG